MKRIASISLILLTLLIAVQPVLYFHYCQGELNSVAFQSTQDKNCCGELPTEGIHEAGCCNDNTVVLSTDNYQAQQVNSNFSIISAFVIVQQHLLITSDHSTDLKDEGFIPVETLFRKVLDRLAFICVYRI
ncbi:hypothetical protein SDC9_49782 [bioreactor metagenome]|jgi:hypothetical protein|uniref:Uncharacterized protein n=1 Tax=bioreactor metagenome TaxID=1076179 RepID=A0A644WI13_9ZZZZ|nr:hypothetical protein [Rikenellaceae bacterium]OJV37636.1 MAG: hypothetical protein BGO33_13305 [Bacteroidia bacterium 43-41]